MFSESYKEGIFLDYKTINANKKKKQGNKSTALSGAPRAGENRRGHGGSDRALARHIKWPELVPLKAAYNLQSSPFSPSHPRESRSCLSRTAAFED